MNFLYFHVCTSPCVDVGRETLATVLTLNSGHPVSKQKGFQEKELTHCGAFPTFSSRAGLIKVATLVLRMAPGMGSGITDACWPGVGGSLTLLTLTFWRLRQENCLSFEAILVCIGEFQAILNYIERHPHGRDVCGNKARSDLRLLACLFFSLRKDLS